MDREEALALVARARAEGKIPDLRRADLRRADLSFANLRRADLRGAYLSRANLSFADLRRADLRGAYLSRADLSRADLSFANLSCADLSFADLSCADLRDATYKDIKIHSMRVFSGLYEYECWAVLSQDNIPYVRMGCLFHSLEEWEKIDIRKSNLSEFPDNRSEKSKRRIRAFRFAKAEALALN